MPLPHHLTWVAQCTIEAVNEQHDAMLTCLPASYDAVAEGFQRACCSIQQVWHQVSSPEPGELFA